MVSGPSIQGPKGQGCREERKKKNGKKSEKKKKVSKNPHGSFSTAKLREKRNGKNFSVR